MLLYTTEIKNNAAGIFIRLIIFFVLITTVSCNQKRENRQIEPSFYYWKSVLNLTEFEKRRLDSLHVETIYLKFFDVDWDEAGKKPVPVAKLQVSKDELPGGISIIPTVFITNACIQKIDSSQVEKLAENIYSLIQEIKGSIGFDSIPEIQVDCDWTAASKEKYFLLLNNIKHKTPGTKLSCTIRLHQVKYISKSGIPPVDRGLLMCYNMGNLKDPATKNSILETEELKKYTGNLSSYPLPLDIALPLFDWKVLYRNNFYTGLIQNLPETVFTNSFSKKTGNRYQVLKDTLLAGYDLKKGDMIRDEQTDIKEILSTANAISKDLKNTSLRVSLYHLDSLTLSKYSTHELESIYNSLH